MAYEEILIGLVLAVIALLAIVLRGISNLKALSDPATVQRVRDMQALGSEAKSVEDRVHDLAATANQALDDYRILRENMAVSSESSLEAFRSSLHEDLEQNRRLVRTVEEASERVRQAAAEMEKRLTAAVERHVGGAVTHKLEPLLENLDKTINRLEARGASPFKTARARILQYLKDRGDIGGKHTAWERALGCLVGHERDVGNAALEDLVRNGLVIHKPTGYGPQVSQDAERLDDVQRVIYGEEI